MPLAKRLQVKDGRRLALVGSPTSVAQALALVEPAAPGLPEVVLLFVQDHARLAARLPALQKSLRQACILWIAYPKLTSTIAVDLNRDIVRTAAPQLELETESLIAIDEDWSTLRMKRLTPDS